MRSLIIHPADLSLSTSYFFPDASPQYFSPLFYTRHCRLTVILFQTQQKIPHHKYSPVEAWRSTSFPLTRYWYSKWDPPPSKVQIVGNSQHTGSIFFSRHPTASHCNKYPAPLYAPLFNTNHDAGARLCHPVPAILI